MYSAYTGSESNAFMSPPLLNNTVKAYFNDVDAVPVTLLYANYNSIKADAFSNNLLQIINSQLLDVSPAVVGVLHQQQIDSILKLNCIFKNGIS